MPSATAWPTSYHKTFEKTIDKVLPAGAQGIVEISNTSGAVQVSGWDRPEVSVHAELDEGVERLDMDSTNGRVNIKVVLPSNSSRHNEAQLRVQVPRGSELHVTTVSADQTIGAVSGSAAPEQRQRRCHHRDRRRPTLS